ncbi:MAG: hypothetical protein COV36_06710 [Alphaproteobacteria bacterium CG11_big_fil_rev_8_21_14_0_20_44_7]|nr:MAG: hypothetical protein COV36_06710 [Alphaproteobacteria bacterium CG11_big_fil_rev_8_21_14_0_20_44_7]
MIRALAWFYAFIQVMILVQIHYRVSYLPSLDLLKILDICTLTPILLLLAKRTRDLRKVVFGEEKMEEVRKKA